jgi:hypothetical protein
MDNRARAELIHAIATRAGTTKQIAEWYAVPPDWLRDFVRVNRAAIEAAKRHAEQAESDAGTLTPQNLDDLWITNKFERLKRLQAIAETTYDDIQQGAYAGGADLAMAVREFRSYLMLAANELGQLLHRGSGDSGTGDTLSVEITGVDMDALR